MRTDGQTDTFRRGKGKGRNVADEENRRRCMLREHLENYGSGR